MIGGFPKRLQQLRERKRINRKVLSELCGLSKNSISRYERGDCEPKASALYILADFFGVTVDYLLCRGEEEK